LENRDIWIKKLIYRSKYTGTRETDLLLGNFAEKYLKNLNDDELLSYEKLLISGDPRIWRLSIDIEQSVDEKENIIVELIKNFKGF
jgi:antitoxin CptB|tara:strand:- start:15 stop:272 length:258 start_codon:yes stop_codon:yes gene_type:complete